MTDQPRGDFEWDKRKARSNLRMHGVSFEEATAVFDDPLSITFVDSEHSTPAEERFTTMGQSKVGLTLTVVHSERANRVRIISARRSTRHERRLYEETGDRT